MPVMDKERSAPSAEELTENIQNNGKEENEMLTAESDFEKSEKLLPILDSKAIHSF